MEFCDLTIKTALKNRIAEQLKDLGYKEGNFYPIEKMTMNDEQELKKLNKLQAYYPGVRVYELGEETIKIQITVTDQALDEFRSNMEEDDYSELSNDNLEALFNERREEFKTFVDEARLALEQLTKIEQVKKQVFENIPAAIMTRLWSLKRELDEHNDWEGIVKGYVGYLLENRDIIEVVTNKLREISKEDPLAYPKMNQLMHLINTSRHIFEDINHFFNKYAPDNRLNKLSEEVLNNIRLADQIIIDAAKDFAIDILGNDYKAKYDEMKAELDSYIRAQESLRSNDAKRNAIIDKNIQKAKDNFERHAPSLDRLNALITGAEGDISWFHAYAQAGITNPDLIVAGFMGKIKEAYRDVNGKVVEFQNDLAQKHQEYLERTGKSDMNPEKLFHDFVEEVEIWFYNHETDQIESVKEVHLVHDVDPAYYTEYSNLDARLQQMKAKYYKATTEEKVQLENDKRALEQEMRALERSTRAKKYIDEYYETYDLLDTVVGGKTIREIRQPYFEQLEGIKRQIRLQNNIPTPEDIQAIDEINRELQALRSTTNKTGDELLIAQTLQKYHARRNEQVRYHISDRKREAFTIQHKDIKRRLAKGQITREDYNNWLQVNTTRVFSQEFTNRSQTIFRQLNRIADKIAELQGRTPDKGAQEAWDELRANVRAFRDHENILNGTLMTEEQILNAKRLEEIIEEIKKDSINYLGLTAQQRAEKEALYEQIGYLNRQKELAYQDGDKVTAKDLRDQITDLWAEIKAIDASVINTPKLASLKSMYEKYMEELAKIRETIPTKYYYSEFDKQLSLWMSENTAVLPPREFRAEGYTYKILDNGLVEVDGVERDDIDLEGVWRLAQVNNFQSSEWFRNNHILKEVWRDGEKTAVMEPLYIWRQSQPKDQAHILSEEPNFNWTDTEVLKKYRNPNYKEGIDGKPIILNRPNPKFRNLNSADKDYLQFLTDMYFEAQEVYVPNQRLGYRVPSIEREFSIYGAMTTDIETTKKQIKRRFTSHEQDMDTELGDTSNRKAQFVPTYFRGRIDADLVSKNLIHSLTQYKAQSIKYENLEKVQPLSQALEQTLSKYPPVDEKFNALAWKLNIHKKILKRGQNYRLETVRQMTDMFIYGEWKKEHKIPVINKRFDKLFDTLLGTRSYFVLAFSSFSQLANLGNGAFNQIIKASVKTGKANFTFKQWLRAYKDLTTKYSYNLVKDSGRIGQKSFMGQMLDLFDVFDGKFLNTAGTEIERKGLRRNIINADIAFIFKNAAEYTLTTTTFIAFARNYIVQVNGRPTALIDAFEVIDGRLKPKQGFEFTDEIRNDVSNKVSLLNRDINGNYGLLDKTLIEREWLGRAIFWMKKFFIPMFMARWGVRRYSYEEGGIIEGYYTSIIRQLVWELGRDVFKDPRNLTMFWDSRSEVDKAQFKRASVEIGMLLVLSALIAMAFDFDEEDPNRWKKAKKRSWFYQSLLSAVLKLNSEAETFVFPFGIDELTRIRKNFLQEIVPMFDQIWAILYKDWNPILDWVDEGPLVKYKRDYRHHEKGDYKIISDGLKLIGLSNSKFDPIQAAQNIELSKLR